MPKTKISEYSTTNADNTDIESINIAEGCAPSGINNAIRELMVHLKEFQTGASGDGFTFAGGTLMTGTNTLSGTNVLSGSTTAAFAAGSASAPSVYASGDTNTGIFFPAADQMAASVGGSTVWNASSTFGFKNRIINGAMMIDQRNAGASVTPGTNAYSLDRWKTNLGSVFTVQQSSTAPTGFVNSLLITSTASTAIAAGDRYGLQQFIEGINLSDLAWGSASAKTITISFWVRSSLTGNFGLGIQNSNTDRSYPSSYTINSANTWEYKTITIPGDTTGTWLTTTGIGIVVYFGLQVGSTYQGTANTWAAADYRSATGTVNFMNTNGATWYITGVQLEVGPSATSFDYRPYGTELQLCQRYYYKMKADGGSNFFGVAYNNNTTDARGITFFPVSMRTAPTALEQNGTAGDYRVSYTGAVTACTSVPTFDTGSVWSASTVFTISAVLTAGQASLLRSTNSNAYLAWSAEL